MPPLGVVLDTNVVVSAHLNEEGFERFVVNLAFATKINLYVSTDILDEYHAVLSRKKFDLEPAMVALSLQRIRISAQLVKPRMKVRAATDEDDNKFLECSEEAGADFLVTGNTRHFPKIWKNTAVVNARELLQVLILHLTRSGGVP